VTRDQGEELVRLVHSAEVIDLALPLDATSPAPGDPPFRSTLALRHGDAVMPGGGSFAGDLVITGTHVGTHVDAPGHFAQEGVLHGGVDAASAQRGGRLTSGGAEELPLLVRRGVLADVAGLLGVDALDPGVRIDAPLLRAAAGAIDAGDVVLIRTGWGAFAHDHDRYLGRTTGIPGITLDAADWLVERGAAAVGADTGPIEAVPAPGAEPGFGHAVHRRLLFDAGIAMVEMLVLEELARRRPSAFVFVMLPLRLTGATASPVRPVAIIA
jgi:kynurenine formamidase